MVMLPSEHYERAVWYTQRGRCAAAHREAEAALREHPDDPLILSLHLATSVSKGLIDFGDAESRIRAMSEAHPDIPLLKFRAAAMRARGGDVAGSLEEIKDIIRGLEVDPGVADRCHTVLAVGLYETDPEAADRHLKAALKGPSPSPSLAWNAWRRLRDSTDDDLRRGAERALGPIGTFLLKTAPWEGVWCIVVVMGLLLGAMVLGLGLDASIGWIAWAPLFAVSAWGSCFGLYRWSIAGCVSCLDMGLFFFGLPFVFPVFSRLTISDSGWGLVVLITWLVLQLLVGITLRRRLGPCFSGRDPVAGGSCDEPEHSGADGGASAKPGQAHPDASAS